ncbi:MAG: transposase family protein, partial [Gemmatimonadota bacterium]|nr:transposase family protein [Gemmatimonadota bacterium]
MSACAGATGVRTSTGETDSAFCARQQDSARAARLIFVGDTGTGNDIAIKIATQIHDQATAMGVSHVFLLGDNIYEDGSPSCGMRRARVPWARPRSGFTLLFEALVVT